MPLSTPADLKAVRADLELFGAFDILKSALATLEADRTPQSPAYDQVYSLIWNRMDDLRSDAEALIERLIPIEAARIAARRAEEAAEDAGDREAA